MYTYIPPKPYFAITVSISLLVIAINHNNRTAVYQHKNTSHLDWKIKTKMADF